MWYVAINNKLIDYADYKYNDSCVYTDLIDANTLDNDINAIVVINNTIQLNPEYNKHKEYEEKKRISKLQCTKRVFVLMLEKMGLDYFEQILPLIEGNRQAKLEWELCVELERSNPLLDILAKELGVTSSQLDKLFQYANGEDVELEVING